MAFIFAAVGSAVGLGNIWRFPYMAGEYGGSAFVLIYIGFVLFIGVPVLMAELTIGRRGGMSPINSVKKIALAAKKNPRWSWIGGLGAFAFDIIAADDSGYRPLKARTIQDSLSRLYKLELAVRTGQPDHGYQWRLARSDLEPSELPDPS